MTKTFVKKEFSSINDAKHSIFTIFVENFALFCGHISKFCSGYGDLFSKMLPWLSVLALKSQRYI